MDPVHLQRRHPVRVALLLHPPNSHNEHEQAYKARGGGLPQAEGRPELLHHQQCPKLRCHGWEIAGLRPRGEGVRTGGSGAGGG